MPPCPDLLQPLSVNHWFSALPGPIREIMVGESKLLHLRSGEMLYRRGDAPDGMYAVVSGMLKLSTLRKDGKEAALAVLEAGTWFAESSLLNGQPRPHDATALRKTEVLMLPGAVFHGLMARVEFSRAIATLLAERIRLLYGVVEAATLRTTRERIVHRLLALAHGDAAADPTIRRRVPVSQEALAMMLGISRQTLNIELKQLVELGAIRVGYRHIELLSEEHLLNMTDMP
ncbi:Crp/Fnr family transcriptional regulator [Oxalobacteraceae bacterium OM1]|nr:Crp/Fnr family transcriptional regulator [Oxalobacteraceae bacterium OM1]